MKSKESRKITSLKDLPIVTILFPTLNGWPFLAKMLTSIKNLNYPKDKIEVIIVDNASTNDTLLQVKRKYPWVKLISLDTNTGSAYPITLGMKKAKGEYILATNDDVVFERNCLLELAKLSLSDRTIGIATAKMLDFDPPHQLAIPGFRINPYMGYQPYDLKGANSVRECDFASGACIFIRNKLLQQIGGFDSEYIFCGDDYDINFQVKALCYKIIYTPKAVFYHRFTRTKNKAGPTQENLFSHYRGKFRYALKNSSPLQILTTFITQVLIGPAYTYIHFRNKTFLPMLKGLAWNIRHFSETMASRQKAKKIVQRFKIDPFAVNRSG